MKSFFIYMIRCWGLTGQETYGTGSYPLPPQGLHLRTRHTANSSPFTGPCLMSACRAYSEQVGVKRQEGGVRGEMAS